MRAPSTFASCPPWDPRSPDAAMEEARIIVLETRRTPRPGPALARRTNGWIRDSVIQQAMTQAGLTLAGARDFAARHGMTFHVDLTPEGARRYAFRVGDEDVVRSTTIRGAFTELAAHLEAGPRLGTFDPQEPDPRGPVGDEQTELRDPARLRKRPPRAGIALAHSSSMAAASSSLARTRA